ncbi:MAG: hypothetical protein OCD76_22820 [Reichenbachiella sp.]
MNNTFSISRFGLLTKKHLIEDHKLYLIPLAAFMGGLFILFFSIHVFNGRLVYSDELKEKLYQITFIAGGILFVGASYPSFRSKESTMSHLLVPSTRLEIFVFEYVSRVLLFYALAPIVYWLMANLELAFASTLFQKLDFSYQPIRFLWRSFYGDMPIHGYLPATLFVLIFFNMAFVGATQYMKQPLVKIFFSVALIWLFYIAFIICSIYLFGTKAYLPFSDFELTLIPTHERALGPFLTKFFIVVNLVLISISYLKLKEKEV